MDFSYMNDIKQEWLKKQLHWDDRDTIQSRRVPKSVTLNWRRMTNTLQSLCKERCTLQGHKLLMIDVGCGAGKFYNGLESAVDLYIGVDPSDRMLLRSAKSRNQFSVRGVGEDLPLQSNIANVVLLKSVLDQCYDPRQVISESYRVLKNGGWLLISLSNRNAYYALFRNLYSRLRRHKSRHFFQESHQFYFNVMDVLIMLKEGHFEVVRQLPIGYFVFPRFLEWLMPEQVFLRCIDLADKIGPVILPRSGGGTIFAGQKSN